jgi:hypothetical protein
MKTPAFLLPAFLLLTLGCQRKLSTTEVKNNLEKAMTAYLLGHHNAGMPPLRFDMVGVTYQESDSNYRCRFTIKLHRPDGSDTTGVISSIVSKDFSTVTAK